MNILHLADLHLGKRVYGYSMLEDQAYILRQFLQIAEREAPDAVILAGDVYDRPVPPIEAVNLLDEFLTGLVEQGIRVFIISGNHDSAERLAFGSRFMEQSGVVISPVYDGQIRVCTLEDEFGPVNFFPIPFLRPAQVHRFFPEEEITDYTEAMRIVLRHPALNPTERNVAIVHQFVTADNTMPETSDSEQISVGGLDRIDGSVFENFDYVALGHLHGTQRIGRDTVRYAGSPLKYSFSELHQKKNVLRIHLGAKGDIDVSQIPLRPMRELAEIKGSFREILQREEEAEHYYHIILTDEQDIPDALSRLRERYPNIMLLDYDNTRTRTQQDIDSGEDGEEHSPEELFAMLYEQQNGCPMDEEQQCILRHLIGEIWEEER